MKWNGQHILNKLPQYQISKKSNHWLLSPFMHITDRWTHYSNMHNVGFWTCLRTGIVVVVHWVRHVCNQSWHVRTYLSNSWHKLQVAAFAHLAVGHRSNTCVYVIAIFTMCESTEEHICIKFYSKIRKIAMETYQLLRQAYSEDAMGRTQVSDWFLRFKEGRTSVESNTHSGWPFFYSEGIIHHEYAPNGQTINKEFYVEVLRHLCESVRWKDWKIGGMATESCTTTMRQHTRHILYSSFWSNTAPLCCSSCHTHQISHRDFFLFPRLKKLLKGHRFETTEDIKWNSMKTLLDILKE